MFKKIKEFFVGKPAVAEPAPAPAPAPYKVEIAPVEASAASMKEELKNPLEVALEQTQAAPTLVVVDGAVPAKKTRKPRAPKAETAGKAVKEKAPAKAKAPKVVKAATTKKPAARTVRSKKA